MALGRKAKKYIREHYPKQSAEELAERFEVPVEEIEEVLAVKKQHKDPLPLKKKIAFYAITFSIPILFFVGMEGILRATNYMGELDLFTEFKAYDTPYLIPNRNFASRYFFYTRTTPSPSTDAFLKEKPANGFRIFTMGGSSAVGYPYGYNGTFSRVVNDVFQDALPGKTVETVNIGTSAINTYTLYDQTDEILAQQPDAIMIYAGHNEFYGALGVGSNENLGAFPGFVRFYLKLQRFKTFLFLRNLIVETSRWFSLNFSDADYDPTATLMERIVDSRSIELGSAKYELAKQQFESNLRAIISKFNEAGVPVFIGSLTSNLKDQPPFVSIRDGNYPPAGQVFREGKSALTEGDSVQALQEFIYAKDLDGLKFRAPSEMNEIIREITAKPNTFYIPVHETFLAQSPTGITGFELFLEHLHPNSDGYFLLGKTYAEAMLNHLPFNFDSTQVNSWENYKENRFLSEFDERVAWHRIKLLKQGWPFVTGKKPVPYQNTYKPHNEADSLAFETVHSEIPWDKAKVDLAEIYRNSGRDELALLEYKGLMRNQPWNDSPFIFAARIELDRGDLQGAKPYLEQAYQINPESAFTTKMLGAVEVNNRNLDRAVTLLEKSRSLKPGDPQTLFNLSGAYGLKNEFEQAKEVLDRLMQIDPSFPGAQAWQQQLNQVLNQQKK